ncbi:MAG: 4Fe-4S binding protein, partial [Candidatus Korarchaeota archaeon]
RGKEHAKWQPTAVATYKEYPHVTIKKCSACGKCVSACIRNILKIENGTCTVENEHLCALCDLCVESCPENAITVETYPGWYIFNIESVGQLTPKRIFIKALDELRSRYEEFNELLEKKLG